MLLCFYHFLLVCTLKKSYSLVFYSCSLLFPHVLFVFILTHSCSTRIHSRSSSLMFILLHSCSACVQSYSLVFCLCSPLFTCVQLVFTLLDSFSLFFTRVPLVISLIHLCSLVFYSCSLMFIGVLWCSLVFPFVWCSLGCSRLDFRSESEFVARILIDHRLLVLFDINLCINRRANV